VSIERVKGRVRQGGHSVPEDVIRRRYDGGLKNFFGLYKPLATGWWMHDNSGGEPRLIAEGSAEAGDRPIDEGLWRELEKRCSRA
jgi:predicted ABC-type ATPase